MRVRTPKFPCFCMMWHSDGSRKALTWVKNITQFWRFWYLKKKTCLRINITLIFMSSSRKDAFVQKFKDRCFCWFPARADIFRTPKGHQHGVSIQSFINVGKTLFQISSIRSIAQTWFLARLFVYSSSFVSQILDFLDWMVYIFIFNGVTEWKQKIEVYENYRGWVDVCYSNLFFILSRNLLQSLFQAAR